MRLKYTVNVASMKENRKFTVATQTSQKFIKLEVKQKTQDSQFSMQSTNEQDFPL
jgi:hypothetical protein